MTLPPFVWDEPSLPTLKQRQALSGALATQLASETDNESYLCDGFRVPDEAVLRLRDLDGIEGYEPGLILAPGSSVTSDFWLVALDDVEEFLAELDAAAVGTLPNGYCIDVEDSVVLGVWRHPESTRALVGSIGAGDWAADFADIAQEDSGHPVWKRVVPLLFGGNDNGPHSLLDTLKADGAVLPPEDAALLWGAVHPDVAGDVLATWVEKCPSVLDGWRPSRPRKPRP
jgi:hypothetical protein